MSSEAFVGQPFGVGRVTVDVLRGEPVLPLSDERFTLLEASGRAMYPVLKEEPVRRILRGLLEMDSPRKVTLYYLFRGDDPFDLSAFTPYEQGVRIKPVHNAVGHRRLLVEWWEQYTKRYQKLLKNRSYPPVAENFLVSMLSRRLDLAVPKPSVGLFGSSKEPDAALSYLLSSESQQLSVDRELLRVESNALLEQGELPTPIAWKENSLDATGLEAVAIEPLASHVPAECFYLRFGNFSNYLWFRDLNKKWQGDLGNMVLQRGIKRAAGNRIQQQLSLRENALAKILGPQVIADAAIIGLDHYAGQGAAIGILFQAKNEFLLSADLTKQRRDALTKFDDATEETLEIQGQSVSYIHTPNGTVRSYYVSDAGFHLVTTSRTLVERFLQAGKGDRSLASLASFQHVRQQFPLEHEHTVLAFVSEEYWQNLCSPHYVIENRRRMRSSREAILLDLARYAAQGEGKIAQTREELASEGFLPARFAARLDGSDLIAAGDQSIDSLRGARGFYVPIADMAVAEVSKAEAAAFERLQVELKQSFKQLPAFVAAVSKSNPEPDQPVTITVDVQVQGALRDKLGTVATWLGQPSKQRMKPVTGDLIAAEAVIDFPGGLAGSDNEEQHLFGALRDFRAPYVIRQGTIQPDTTQSELVRGYLGAWPKPGLLQLLTGAEEIAGPEPQPAGADIWQAKQDEFLLLSFKPEVIEEVLPQLELVPAERSGQLWLQVQDLTGTLMAENLSAFGYMRTRDASRAGSRMMNSIANQLQVPRNECRAVAERLIDGDFICPLGGEYQLYEPKRGLEVWASSALPAANRFLLTEIPADFHLPLLNWFRGLKADLRLDEQGLEVHLELKLTEAALPE